MMTWHAYNKPMSRFERTNDYVNKSLPYVQVYMDEDQSHGVIDEVGTILKLPTGEVVVAAFDRNAEQGMFNDAVVGIINQLYPDFTRAALVAARLGEKQVHNMVEGMASLNLPCAALAENGRVLATNALFECQAGSFLNAAGNKLYIPYAPANAQLHMALSCRCAAKASSIRSIAIPSIRDHPAMVLHIIPIQASAHDIFTGSHALVVATEVNGKNRGPALDLLQALFHMTPKEAHLSHCLAEGHSLKESAARLGIGFGTARSYLLRIFEKTDTHHQTGLVNLLNSASRVLGIAAG
ncbi:helix-turn-helix transcriptional regulator (plasmid) [Phyllobacterium sp. 628]|uniref:helix-turn-helix transcriptional regulator n=1 Tax=Phyllobacterium sp. 628 TaxID=2718938 RepID=UPI00166245DE|nr:helix-turn-helix transcriptional regulator [Phyllobacterium sp. 628]QND54802.1 helix-turn-helix transcriptional regulator [Phyllobacterium sp. 628]